MSNPIETENTNIKLNNDVTDNDIHLQVQHLLAKVSELEKEKNDIHDNFNAQRARLQKLYMQKEEELTAITTEHVHLESEVEKLTKELNEAKSQLCIAGIRENEVEAEKIKAQAEIANLNQIVQDTVEVSCTSQSEVKKLRQVIQQLELQLKKLQGEKEKEGLLLAPSNMLSGAKTLARKVVGQLGNDSDYRLHDNLEDSMKKAQEDTEVLRSLVMPLEEKIQELTEKLLAAEERLKVYEPDNASLSSVSATNRQKLDKTSGELSHNTSQESANHSSQNLDTDNSIEDNEIIIKLDGNFGKIPPGIGSSLSKTSTCNMCANYEAHLVSQQKMNSELQKEKEIIEMNLEKLKEDFVKETQFRKIMEDKWNEKKEKHKAKVAELLSLYETAESEVKNLRETFAKVTTDVKQQLAQLSFDREEINAQLVEIQKENDNLMGKHSRHSSQLREESINFPDNVEELQILLLKTHEELITAKIAKEAKEEHETNLKCEIQLLNNEISARNAKERDLVLRNTDLSNLLTFMEKENMKLKNLVEKINTSDKEQKEQLKTLKAQILELTNENRRCKDNISKLQSRVGSLQQQLDDSEVVQKDFVRLSQSLQIELEKIRGADTEVRWQHEDDVDDCPGCKISFSGGKKKDHCRHCGQIFCPSCLSRIVVSGPRKRQARVCQVCHTLLNREIAPYFSQEPPHTAD